MSRKRKDSIVTLCVLWVAISSAGALCAPVIGSAGTVQPPRTACLKMAPALFVENRGQWADRSIRYVHDGDPIDVAMTDSGLIFRVGAGPRQFTASFVGASITRPAGMDRSAGSFNYCLGDRADWTTAPSYGRIVYRGLYDGIDLHVRGLRSRLKYEFHVAPGADYRRIAVRYDGIDGLSIREDGSLAVDLGRDGGVIRDDAPYIYQEIDGRKVELAGRFVLCGERTYAFAVTGDLRPDRALVIDPNLAWGSYLGGAKSDFATDVAADADGNVYVVGRTESAGWATGGYDTKYEGNYGDAFVSKLSGDGAHLWTTYLGGTMGDSARGVTVDAKGNVYVVGATTSPSWANGGYDRQFEGNGDDGFIAVLSKTGAHIWSSYIGGVDIDVAEDVAVDAAGYVYVAGSTKSTGWVVGGPDTSFNGIEDVFLVRLTRTGGHSWSTYVGGTKKDYDAFVAVDANSVYVAGTTESPGWVQGGYDTSFAGTSDAFVAKISDAGKSHWSTYLGGASVELAAGLACDNTGAVYAGGTTTSTGWIQGGYDTTLDLPVSDAFVVKLTPIGQHVWSSYVGGMDMESADDLCVDDANNVYIVGDVVVDKGVQPALWVSGGYDTIYNGGYDDGFIAKLTSGGAHVWSGFVGGANDEGNAGVAVNAAGDVFVVGGTISPAWITGGFDKTLNGEDDAFVIKISDTATGTIDPNDGGTVDPNDGGTTHDGLSPLYRFWSPVYSRHFYTASETEKQDFIDKASDTWTYEGIAYYVPSDANAPGSKPVYRFKGTSSVAYFYTINEAEKDSLIRDYGYAWTYESIAFRAYPLDAALPAGTAPVYRFWSATSSCHFYTINEAEKDGLIRDYSTFWTYEGIAWYAYPQ